MSPTSRSLPYTQLVANLLVICQDCLHQPGGCNRLPRRGSPVLLSVHSTICTRLPYFLSLLLASLQGLSARWAPFSSAACSPAQTWGLHWGTMSCGRRRRWRMSASSLRPSSFPVGVDDTVCEKLCGVGLVSPGATLRPSPSH